MSNDIFPLKSQVDQGDPAPSSPSGQCSKSSPETGSGLSANVPIAPAHKPAVIGNLEMCWNPDCQYGHLVGKTYCLKCGWTNEGPPKPPPPPKQITVDDVMALIAAYKSHGPIMSLPKPQRYEDCKAAALAALTFMIENGEQIRTALRVSDQKGATKERSHSDATVAKRTPAERDPKGDAQEEKPQ